MKNILDNNKITIDVIIPLFYPNNSIKILIFSLLSQSYKINKIIIINSGATNKINNFLHFVVEKNDNIIMRKFNKLNPGEARNIGINLSNAKYLAFFDVNTFLELDWIEKNLITINSLPDKVLYGQRITLANTFVKNINKWSTYGEAPYMALTGTLIEASFLKKNKLFFKSPRAGEDIEWIARTNKFNLYRPKYSTQIYYNGIFDSFLKTMKKWFNYSFAYANIKKDINHQKKLFFLTSLYLIFCSYFLIKINIYLLIFFIMLNLLFYFIYFSIIRPLKKKVKFSMLFPFNWLLVGMYRFCLDLAKFPGLLYGQLKIFFRKD